jgi:hypothetical protein
MPAKGTRQRQAVLKVVVLLGFVGFTIADLLLRGIRKSAWKMPEKPN